MADLEYPPLPAGDNPAPLSPSIPLNPPMVGEASPFTPVSGENRDTILSSIRAWIRGPLLGWSTAWQTRLTAWLTGTTTWLNGWNSAISSYVTETVQEGVDGIIAAEIEGVEEIARDSAIETIATSGVAPDFSWDGTGYKPVAGLSVAVGVRKFYGPVDPHTIAGIPFNGEEIWFRKADGEVIQRLLFAHYRADDINQAVGSVVASWNDRKGSNHLVAAGAPHLGLDATVNRKFVSGDGLDDMLTAAGFVLPQPSTVFVVGRYVNDAGSQTLIGSSDATGRNVISVASGKGEQIFAGTILPYGATLVTAKRLRMARFNGASSAFKRATGSLVVGNAGAESWKGLRLFANTAGDTFYPAEIYEIVIYNGLLTDSEETYNFNMLTTRYGL